MDTQDQQDGSSSKLPGMLRALFWDYEFEELTWEYDRDLIIRRVLIDGTWDAVTWLRSCIGDIGLREWIKRHQGRGLSPKQLRFWELILGLPHRQVNAWLKAEERKVWDKRVIK
ncbi:MAG: hypothetical protein HY731_08740 [Candidatus Tectomicrobia bacterium]|nr:hypothetical protein [Candidatus Tectomicrobia bacterium]